jgi:hypothetical protein
MTAEEKVKAKYPDACDVYAPRGFFWTHRIENVDNALRKWKTLSEQCKSEADAWEDAASRIEVNR